MNYNKVMLAGKLTRDIEIKHLANSQAIANFGLAINRRYKTAAGEAREDVVFIDCEAWGRTAETMAQYLAKGRGVFIEGRLQLDQWQDKDGGKRSKIKVVVDSFQFTDAPPERSERAAPAPMGGKVSHPVPDYDGAEPLPF